MSFSRKTIVALAEVLSANGHTWFDKKFYELHLESRDPGGNLNNRALGLVRALAEPTEVHNAGGLDEQEREAALLELAEEALRPPWPAGGNRGQRLEDALKLDGFEYRDERLIPTTPEPAPLAPEITALEAVLIDYNLATAATHYRQAVDNLADGNAEACNGQLRSFLEDLFCELGARITRQEREDAVAALTDLRNAKFLDNGEWNMLRGIWQAFHERGPHRGLSDSDEALFRTHVATAAGRYLMHKVGTFGNG